MISNLLISFYNKDDGLNFNNQKSNQHAHSAMEKEAKKMHFRKFESMRFQRQGRQSQEKRIDSEM